MDETIPTFDRPIPGQSLTLPPGATKMEKPPQFPKPEDAAEYFWEKLTSPKSVIKLEVMLRKDTPVDYITRTILFAAISEGIITVDVALLIANIVFNQIISIAKLKKIPYIAKEPDRDLEEFLDANLDVLDKMKPAKEVDLMQEKPRGNILQPMMA